MNQRRNGFLWGSAGSAIVFAALLAAGPSSAFANVSSVNRGPDAIRSIRGGGSDNDGSAVSGQGGGDDGGGAQEAVRNDPVGTEPTDFESDRSRRPDHTMYPDNGAEGSENVQQQSSGQKRDDQLSPWTEPDGDPSDLTPDDSDACPYDCAGDDGFIDVTDLLRLLSEWGTPGPHDCDVSGPQFRPGGDGVVGVNDILALLTAWGRCG